MAYLIFSYLWEFALGAGFPWTPSLPLLERVLLESSWGTACGGVPACNRRGTDQGSWVRAGYTAKTDGREKTGSMSQQSLRTQVRGAVCKLSVASAGSQFGFPGIFWSQPIILRQIIAHAARVLAAYAAGRSLVHRGTLIRTIKKKKTGQEGRGEWPPRRVKRLVPVSLSSATMLCEVHGVDLLDPCPVQLSMSLRVAMMLREQDLKQSHSKQSFKYANLVLFYHSI